jgi:hypothetical protein
MQSETRAFFDALGGYRAAAERLGKRPTTVHTHMQAGSLPASWYDALCRLAREDGIEEPPRSMFSFLKIDEERAA